MYKRLRVILAITLALFLSVGLVTISGCDGVAPNGDAPNGDEPNGDEPDIQGLGIITGVSSDSTSDLGIGKPAPDFWFDNAEGQSTSLSDFKGKIVLLNFWTTWCTYCRQQMPYIEQVYEEWPGEELVVLAINVGESSDDVASFMQSQELTHPVLLDSKGQVYTRYVVPGLPTTFFIDKEGLIQNYRIGAFESTEQIESILNQLK